MTKSKCLKKCWSAGRICCVVAAILFTVWSCKESEKSAQEWIQQGVEHFEAQRYAQAARAYRQAVEKESENAVVHNLLGMAYRFQYNKTGDPTLRERETAAFRRAVELNPRFVAAIKNLAVTLKRDGNHREASRLARRALELFPQDPEKPLLESWIRQYDEEGDQAVSLQ